MMHSKNLNWKNIPSSKDLLLVTINNDLERGQHREALRFHFEIILVAKDIKTTSSTKFFQRQLKQKRNTDSKLKTQNRLR